MFFAASICTAVSDPYNNRTLTLMWPYFENIEKYSKPSLKRCCCQRPRQWSRLPQWADLSMHGRWGNGLHQVDNINLFGLEYTGKVWLWSILIEDSEKGRVDLNCSRGCYDGLCLHSYFFWLVSVGGTWYSQANARPKLSNTYLLHINAI